MTKDNFKFSNIAKLLLNSLKFIKFWKILLKSKTKSLKSFYKFSTEKILVKIISEDTLILGSLESFYTFSPEKTLVKIISEDPLNY